MTKKIQEIALSFFLVACGISLLVGLFWVKPVLESQRALIQETRINQEKFVESINNTKEIVTEAGYAIAAIAMLEKRMIKPTEANKMIDASLSAINDRSARLGKLAKIINDYRINHEVR